MFVNSYIHGTNSSILELLPLTNFELIDSISMIENYKVAPIGGEIKLGGNSTITARCNPCFGRVKKENNNSYDWNKVLKYTNIKIDQSPVELLKEQIEIGVRCNYANINVILIYMVRCLQSGYENIITKEIINDIKLTSKALSFLLFIGNRIRTRKGFRRGDITEAVYTCLTINELKNRLKDIEFSIEDFKPEYIDILTLPEKLTIKSGLKVEDKEVIFNQEERRPFVVDNISVTRDLGEYEAINIVYCVTHNVPGESINSLLAQYLMWMVNENFWSEFHIHLKNYIEVFNHRISLLEKQYDIIVNIPKKIFPIIIVMENDELLKNIGHEYRAVRSLKFGVDIKTVATDSYLHKLILQNFFVKYNIDCTVKYYYEINDELPKQSWCMIC